MFHSALVYLCSAVIYSVRFGSSSVLLCSGLIWLRCSPGQFLLTHGRLPATACRPNLRVDMRRVRTRRHPDKNCMEALRIWLLFFRARNMEAPWGTA